MEEINKTIIDKIKYLADKGDKEAQLIIANMYYNGIGTVIDRSEAFKYYKFLADGGNTESQVMIANMYYNGIGVK